MSLKWIRFSQIKNDYLQCRGKEEGVEIERDLTNEPKR
jgi:hypothetical protein